MMETGADSAMHKCTEQEFGEFMETDGTRIIWSLIHRYGKGLDHEEAFQELQIALWRALLAYRPNPKTKKTTFVYTAVYNRIKMMIRENNTDKRLTDYRNIPIEACPNASIPSYNMEDQVVEKNTMESRANTLHWAIRNGGLTEEEQFVARQTIQETQQKDIGEKLGCSQSRVSVLKSRAFKKIKMALQDAQWDGVSI